MVLKFLVSRTTTRQLYRFSKFYHLYCPSPIELCHYLVVTGDLRMARKRYLAEDALQVLREIVVHLYDGLDVMSSCGNAGMSDKSY